MATNSTVNIFIAYSRLDTEYLTELRKYLKPLERTSHINLWYDGEIKAGEVWDKKIKEQLHQADIVILLVSANSIYSDYFYDIELEDALKRHNNNETIVIPIILKNCPWHRTPLKDLQALPHNGKPINKWEHESDAYTNIFNELDQRISNIINERQAAKKLAEEEKRRIAEEKQRKKEKAKRKAEEEKRLQAEAEAKKLAEEERRRKEEEQRKKEEAQKKAEAEAKKLAEEEQKRGAEEEQRKIEEAKRKTEEERRLQAEAEAKKLSEEKQHIAETDTDQTDKSTLTEVNWKRYSNGDYNLFDIDGNVINNNDIEDSWSGQDYLVYLKNTRTTYLLLDFKNIKDDKLRPAKKLGQHEAYWRSDKGSFNIYRAGSNISQDKKFKRFWKGNDLYVLDDVYNNTYLLKGIKNLHDNQLRPAIIIQKTIDATEPSYFKRNQFAIIGFAAIGIIAIVVGIMLINNYQDESAWNDAKLYNTVYYYERYQSNFPNGSHYYEAGQKINELKELEKWDEAQNKNTPESYRQYLEDHPYGDYVNNAEKKLLEFEQSDWNLASFVNTMEAYEEYLIKHPNGSYSSEATKNLENAIASKYAAYKVRWRGNKEEFSVLDNLGNTLTGPDKDIFDGSWCNEDYLIYNKRNKMSYLLEGMNNHENPIASYEYQNAKILGNHEVYWRSNSTNYWVYKHGKNVSSNISSSVSDANDLIINENESDISYVLPNYKILKDNKLRPANKK